MYAGSGNFILNGAAGTTYTIGAATVGGTITIGGTAQDGPMILGSSNAVNTLSIAHGSGATVCNVCDVQTGGSFNVGTSMTNGTITIGGTGAHTGPIHIGPSTSTLTLNVANTNGKKTINVGSGIDGNNLFLGNGGNTSAQTISIACGASGANSTVSILNGAGAAGTQTCNILGAGATRAGVLNLGIGAASHAINIGSSSAGAITVGVGAGNFALSGNGNTVGIANDAAVNTVILGSTTGASKTTIKGGSDGIVITPTAGDVSMAPATGTVASPGATVVLDSRVGSATDTGFVTAAGATQDFVVTNAKVLTTSSLYVTLSALNASGLGAWMRCDGVRVAAGSFTVHAYNAGVGALGAGDTVRISWWILD